MNWNLSNMKFLPHPIGYSIPEIKIVKEIPKKDRDFAIMEPNIPGVASTYLYEKEEDYYDDYKRSFFGITRKKSGWDCLRHYEILANGCIPYFLDLDQAPKYTMYFLPKELILEAMHLEGVFYRHIDHTKFNTEKYCAILHEILQHTRHHLSTKQMASYLLNSINYSGSGNILFLSQNTLVEYLRDLMLIGLKELLGNRVIDSPKIDHIYQSFLPENVRNLYARGITYSRIVKDFPTDRTNIEDKIKNKSFDLIIYGEMHQGDLPLYDLVKNHYTSESIAYIYAAEYEHLFCSYNLQNLFVREYHQHKTGL